MNRQGNHVRPRIKPGPAGWGFPIFLALWVSLLGGGCLAQEAGNETTVTTGSLLQGPTISEKAFAFELNEAAGPADAPLLLALGVSSCSRVDGKVGNVPVDVQTFVFQDLERAFCAFSAFLQPGAKALADWDVPDAFLQGDQVVYRGDRTVVRVTFRTKWDSQLFSLMEWLRKTYPTTEPAPALVRDAPKRDRCGVAFQLARTDRQGDALFPGLPKGALGLSQGNTLYIDSFRTGLVRYRAGWIRPRDETEKKRLLALAGLPSGRTGETLSLAPAKGLLAIFAGPKEAADVRDAALRELARRAEWNWRQGDPDLAGALHFHALTAIDIFIVGIKLIAVIFGICAGLAAVSAALWILFFRRFGKSDKSPRRSHLGLS